MSVSWRIHEGDCRDVLPSLPAGSVHTVVTSPPYFGLRDYGTGEWDGGDEGCDHSSQSVVSRASSGLDGATATQGGAIGRGDCRRCGATRTDRQIGLEPTPDEFVAALVGVFREVRRVLRDDGTVWLNLGDSYASGGSGGASPASTLTGGGGRYRDGSKAEAQHLNGFVRSAPDGYKPKDLIGIPWMVAFALRADGWFLRSDIIWAKPNPMPESVTDRPTKAHEYLFLLSKGPRYFYDADAIREEGEGTWNHGGYRNGRSVYLGGNSFDNSSDEQGIAGAAPQVDGRRNKRSVWTVATQPFSGAALSGKSYTASPDCPEHGLRACPETWRTVADGGPQDQSRYRIDSTVARHALRLLDGDDASSFRTLAQTPNVGPSTEREQTAGSDLASRTSGPSSGASGLGSDGPPLRTTSTAAPNESRLGSPDSLDLDGASTASAHNTGTRRSDSPSGLGDSADAGPLDRTPCMEPSDAGPGPDGSGTPATSETVSRSARTCTCTDYSVDHFATFPPKLIEPCVLAGCPERACGECGAPWERVVEREVRAPDERRGNKPIRYQGHAHADPRDARGQAKFRHSTLGMVGDARTVGFEPSCPCNAEFTAGTVLDPFAGAGTTGMVALRHNRSFIGVELNPEYAEMARWRIRDDAPLMNQVSEVLPAAPPAGGVALERVGVAASPAIPGTPATTTEEER